MKFPPMWKRFHFDYPSYHPLLLYRFGSNYGSWRVTQNQSSKLQELPRLSSYIKSPHVDKRRTINGYYLRILLPFLSALQNCLRWSFGVIISLISRVFQAFIPFYIMFVLCNVMLLDYRTFFRRLLAEKTRENDSETLDFIISLVFKKMKLATRPSLLLVSGSVLFCFFFTGLSRKPNS